MLMLNVDSSANAEIPWPIFPDGHLATELLEEAFLYLDLYLHSYNVEIKLIALNSNKKRCAL